MNAAASAIDTKIRLLTAIRAVRALRANPEDTRQIFVIFKALRGKSGLRLFDRFKAGANGQRILAERRSLLDVLGDHAYLSGLPESSVGRAYLAFMQSENLSAEGLVMASEADEILNPDMRLFRDRLRDAHDLTHILTGYGRDALGELCLLAFMNRHSRNPGQLLIVAMSWSRLPKPARRAVWQAWRQGGKADWLLDQDFETLLGRPLADVRGELGILPPTRYRSLVQ